MCQSGHPELFNLYSIPDKLYIDPVNNNGTILSKSYLEIDRATGNMAELLHAEQPITVKEATLDVIFGVVGLRKLVYGVCLIAINRAEVIGEINGHKIWATEGFTIHYYSPPRHQLTPAQTWCDRILCDMLRIVLHKLCPLYFSYTFDLTRDPMFNTGAHMEHSKWREPADQSFVWNECLLESMMEIPTAARCAVRILEGSIHVKKMMIQPADPTVPVATTSRLCLQVKRKPYRRYVNEQRVDAIFEKYKGMNRDAEGKDTATCTSDSSQTANGTLDQSQMYKKKAVWWDNGYILRKYYQMRSYDMVFDRIELRSGRTRTDSFINQMNSFTKWIRNEDSPKSHQLFEELAFHLWHGNLKAHTNNIRCAELARTYTLSDQALGFLAATFSMVMTLLCLFLADSWTPVFFWLFNFVVFIRILFGKVNRKPRKTIKNVKKAVPSVPMKPKKAPRGANIIEHPLTSAAIQASQVPR